MKKILGSIVFVIYVAIVLTVTILLLSYNEYMCSEINGYTFYIVRDDMLEPDYVKGDLLIIKHVSNKNVDIGKSERMESHNFSICSIFQTYCLWNAGITYWSSSIRFTIS